MLEYVCTYGLQVLWHSHKGQVPMSPYTTPCSTHADSVLLGDYLMKQSRCASIPFWHAVSAQAHQRLKGHQPDAPPRVLQPGDDNSVSSSDATKVQQLGTVIEDDVSATFSELILRPSMLLCGAVHVRTAGQCCRDRVMRMHSVLRGPPEPRCQPPGRCPAPI